LNPKFFLRRTRSTAESESAEVSSPTSGVWFAPPHRVLLIDGGVALGSELFEALDGIPDVALERITIDRAPRGAAPTPFDVAVVALSEANLDALSFSLRMRKNLGRPEVVFVTDDPDGPIAAGLAELGIELILPLEAAKNWLREELPTLTIVARTRRAHDEGRARLGIRGIQPPDLRTTRGLFVAERAYRETYVRGLLALTESRREAAALARVSYRTLSHILAKLGIAPRAPRGALDDPDAPDSE